MTVWKYPLSRKMIQRSMIATLGAALLMPPLHAFATDEGPKPMHLPLIRRPALDPAPRLQHKSRRVQSVPGDRGA